MTASRPFDTGPGAVPAPARAVSWDSQRSTAVSDVAHLHTEYLDPPAHLRSLMPPEVLSHPAPVTHGPQALHPPLPAPMLPPSRESDPWTAAIEEHLRAAQRLHEEADHLHDTLTVYSAQANTASQRWFTLMHTPQRTSEHAVVCAQLENQILAFSRELASLRQRWSACMTQAREYEDAARLMQAASDPRK
jgi:hypothetical protein